MKISCCFLIIVIITLSLLVVLYYVMRSFICRLLCMHVFTNKLVCDIFSASHKKTFHIQILFRSLLGQESVHVAWILTEVWFCAMTYTCFSFFPLATQLPCCVLFCPVPRIACRPYNSVYVLLPSSQHVSYVRMYTYVYAMWLYTLCAAAVESFFFPFFFCQQTYY